MITEVKDAIRDKLIGDATFLELLGNPTDEYRSVFWFLPPTAPGLPRVILTASPGMAEPVDRAILSEIGTLTVTAWATTNLYEQIAERVIFLLHQAVISATHAIRLVLSVENGEMYDDSLRAYGKAITFSMFSRRAII
jgi:hypothetical protein